MLVFINQLHSLKFLLKSFSLNATHCYYRNIGATDNKMVAICAFGEGWHNYHHVFPWDYKAAELGNYSTNLSTALIDFAAKHGKILILKHHFN